MHTDAHARTQVPLTGDNGSQTRYIRKEAGHQPEPAGVSKIPATASLAAAATAAAAPPPTTHSAESPAAPPVSPTPTTPWRATTPFMYYNL